MRTDSTEPIQSENVEAPWFKSNTMNPSTMVDAHYRTDESNPKFASNPAITCLPGLPSEGQAQKFLAKEPNGRGVGFSELPVEVRIEHAAQVAEIFVPTPALISGFRDSIRVIRNCYGRANIGSPQFMNHLHRVCLSQAPMVLPQMSGYQGSSGGIVLVGPTGVGKSCLLDQLQDYIGKRLFIHRTMNGSPCCWPQIPILRISAAGRNTPKTLSLGIGAKIDDIRNDPLKQAETSISRSTDYVTQLSRLLSSDLVGLLIVEDVQLWARVDRRLKISMLNLLVGIQEESRVPVMCVGTMLLKDVLESNLSQTDKLMAEGQIVLKPLLDMEEMRDLCRKFWQYRVTPGPDEPPDWLPGEMFLHTAGLRRYARELSIPLFQQMAIDQVEIPTRKYFREVAGVALQHAKPAVEILRRAYRGRTVDRRDLQRFEEYIAMDNYRALVYQRDAALKMLRT